MRKSPERSTSKPMALFLGLYQNAPLARMGRCLQTKSIILIHPLHSDTVPAHRQTQAGATHRQAKEPEMLMYIPLSELLAALPPPAPLDSDTVPIKRMRIIPINLTIVRHFRS